MKRFLLPLPFLLFIPVLLFAMDFQMVTFKTENAGKVIFDHDLHLKKLGSNCTVCHKSIFPITTDVPPVTMAEMEQGKSCGACHNKTKAFGLNECVKCHLVKEVPIQIPQFGTIVFSHNFHLGMYGCGDCHNKLFKPAPGNPHISMRQMEQGASCGACHDGNTAFTVKENCTKCHAVKDIAFTADALFSHKFHLEMYKCADCHSKLFVAGPESKRHSMRDMEQGNSCGGCHEGSTAFSVKGDCGKCHTATKDIPFKATDALFSHKFHLGIYRCNDCHSGLFVGGAGSKRYTMADMAKLKSCGACHEGDVAFTVNANCGRCHKSTKDITFDIPDIGSVAFSHEIHLGMYKCDDCHNQVFATGVSRKSFIMAEMEKGKSCGACHDGKSAFTASANCGKCHPVKDITFTDDARFSHTKHLDMYKCADCHSKLFVAGPDNKRRSMADMEKGLSCGACHEGNTGFSVKGDCDKCHKSTMEIAFNVPATGVTYFSHAFHTGMYKCADCHNGIFTTGASAKRYTMGDMEQGKSCGSCHDSKTAFSVKDACQKCHPVKEIQFKESGASFSHKFHLGLYPCNDCHTKLFIPGKGNRRVSMPEMEKGKSCGACHDSSTAFTVTGSCNKCHNVTKAVKYELPEKTGSVLFSHKLHLSKGYNCGDCHNGIILAGVGRKPLKMKDMEEGKSCGACHGAAMAFSVKDAASCGRCHGGRTGDIPSFQEGNAPQF
ncbi:cytochrome c, 27 heme-binding sites [Geotalea daltonii FRC-32]|uniref:Cytochrome c, 27 heme-binding sites n=1 Tax=Geotalea daltonii (strain DSM 22248 / JCM 15807 / FRC-32) TaxID=316067 RepID=B9M9F2_GEODF|nr:cytochrome c3 family protein [Geotalea daltonii]ACM20524.1 cytochrome c, 27 heme-binding sites [Geotalea daltonii FRC-32]